MTINPTTIKQSTIELKISGMSCGHCVAAVQKALSSVAGSQEVHVNLAEGRAQVSGEADSAALVAAVVAEGYSAEVL